MAKGIGNGFPMGAVVTTPGEIMLDIKQLIEKPIGVEKKRFNILHSF